MPQYDDDEDDDLDIACDHCDCWQEGGDCCDCLAENPHWSGSWEEDNAPLHTATVEPETSIDDGSEEEKD